MVEKIKLQNLTTQKIIDLVADINAFILESVDWSTVDATHSTYKYINQIGVSIVNTALETRTVEIVGYVFGHSTAELLQNKQFLNNFVNPQQAIRLGYKEYYIDFNPTNSVRYGTTLAENNNLFCRFIINGICPQPLFNVDDKLQIDASTTLPMFHFPLIIPPGGLVFGLKQISSLIDVYNSGSVETGMLIIFKALSSCSGVKLTNASTLEYFEINKTLSAGEVIKINTNVGQKSVIGKTVGNTEQNYYQYKTLDSTWLQLQPGDNLFRVDATPSTALETSIQFANQYLEVQELD